jgi:hypothetical protein
MEKLLTREKFRNITLEKFNKKCAFCDNIAVDAHHIYERKLWIDEGYYLSNGCPLCEKHHRLAERDMITPSECRRRCNHLEHIHPDIFASNILYNKWGDKYKKPNRIRIKYPSTPYLYDFELNTFVNCDIVITEKMDGGNCSFKKDEPIWARSDSALHPSFDLLKNRMSQLNLILENSSYQYFGEWLYATHTIEYNTLRDYFLGFGIYDDKTNEFLSWDQTEKEFEKVGLKTVPVLFKGTFDKQYKLENKIQEIFDNVINNGGEGIIIRNFWSFQWCNFDKHITKEVRPNHVQTDVHWSRNWKKTKAKIIG